RLHECEHVIDVEAYLIGLVGPVTEAAARQIDCKTAEFPRVAFERGAEAFPTAAGAGDHDQGRRVLGSGIDISGADATSIDIALTKVELHQMAPNAAVAIVVGHANSPSKAVMQPIPVIQVGTGP